MAEQPVTIAVVNTNGRDYLRACLESIAPEAEAGRAEAWVVDNASTDGSAQMVEREFPWVELVASNENLGFPQAANLVADRTEGEWFATANEDVELEPGALETLLGAAATHPEAAIVAPRLVMPDGSTQHTVYSFPTFLVTAAHHLGLQRLSRRLGERLLLEGYWDPERARHVPWAFAAFVLIRRDAFDSVGGFGRDLWMYADDLDLAWRLHEKGWSVWYEPSARVLHHGGAATLATFGDARTATRVAATYAWMVKRRGVAVTWATAGVSYAVMAARRALYGPLARIAPGRFGRERDRAAFWMSVHREGLRRRGTILAADERAASALEGVQAGAAG
jgi:N-acetylglucosaminyl-diphospho-decaprenol L-rhamnosyltransferase